MYKTLSALSLLLFSMLFTPRIQAACPFTVSIGTSPGPLCAGSCVTLTATATGGVMPYTYAWSTLATTATITVCNPGTYSVTVTDAMGCAVSSSYTFSTLTPITVMPQVLDATCFGSCDGAIDLSNVTGGGGPPYMYQWSIPTSIPIVTGLCAGSYTCTITSAAGCTAVQSFTVTEPTPLIASVTSNNTTCANACNGTANVTVTGGTPYYTYMWSNGATGNPMNNLCPGTYQVWVTDANNCTANLSFSILAGGNFSVNLGASPSTQICQGSSSVQLNAIPYGGTPAYTYQWTPPTGLSNPNIVNPIASPATATTYTCTVTDMWGCQASNTISITLNTLCSAPSFRYTSNITQTSARFNWGQAACASQFQVRYRRANTTTYTTATVAGSQSSYTAAALLNNTSYRWSMRTQCTGGAWSLWSPELSFSTPLILNPARQDPDADVPVYDAPETGLYPNPAQHSVTLRCHLENPAPVHIRLYDLTGRSLRDLHMQGNAGQNEWELSLEAVPTGLYWMELSSGESRELLRLAVER